MLVREGGHEGAGIPSPEGNPVRSDGAVMAKPWPLLLVATTMSACVSMAGCADKSPGIPRGQGNPGTVTETSDEPATASDEPSGRRPREIKLDGMDPCSLIPPTDWPKFRIEKPGKQIENPTFKSPECSYAKDSGGVAVTLVITEGIDVWTDGGRSAQVEEADPVEGFPTLSATLEVDPNRCDALVDVADGQYLKAYAAVRSQKSELPEKCEFARQVAESAMRTLTEL
jgi:hypothetical protein